MTKVCAKEFLFRDVICAKETGSGQDLAQHRIRFSCRPGRINIQLASLQLVVIRELIDDLIHDIYEVFSQVWRVYELYTVGCPENLSDTFHDGQVAVSTETNLNQVPKVAISVQVAIRGSQILTVAPVSPPSAAALVLLLPEFACVFSSSSVVLSANRARLLTVAAHSVSPHKSAIGVEDCTVFSSAVDVDVRGSFTDRLPPVNIAHEAHANASSVVISETQEWVVRVHSNAIVLSAAQIVLVADVFSKNILLSTPSNPDSSRQGLGVEVSSSSLPRECLPECLYRTSVSIEAPGLAVELVREDSVGQVKSGLASASLGSLSFSLFSDFSTEPATNQTTCVMRWNLKISSIFIQDRRVGVPDQFRLVVKSESSDGNDHDLYPIEKSLDRPMDITAPCLVIDLHDFRHNNESPQAKIEISFRSPQVVVCSLFIHDVYYSFAKALSGRVEPPQRTSSTPTVDSGSVKPASTVLDADDIEQDTSAPTFKFSAVVSYAKVFLLERPISSMSRAVEISIQKIKISSLFTATMHICPGSFARFRDMGLSLRSMCQISSLHALSDVPSGQISHGRDMSLMSVGDTPIDYSSRNRDDDTVQCHSNDGFVKIEQNNSKETMCTPMLVLWTVRSNAPVALVFAKSITFRPPVGAVNISEVAVSTVYIDSTLQDLANLYVTAKQLDITQTDSMDTATDLPAVRLRMTDISLSARIPQHRLAQMTYKPRIDGDGSSTIKWRTSFVVELGLQPGSVYGSFDFGDMEAFDGQTGVWETCPVVEQFNVETRVEFLERRMSINFENNIRTNITPVIAKVIAHCVSALRSAVLHAEQQSLIRTDMHQSGLMNRFGSSQSHAVPLSFEIACHCAGAEFVLISENLRLLTVFAGVDCRVSIPCNITFNGQVEFSVGYVQVINLQRRNSSQAGGRDWSVLVSPSPRLLRTNERRQMMAILDDRFSNRRTSKLMQLNLGGSRDKGGCRQNFAPAGTIALVLSPKSASRQQQRTPTLGKTTDHRSPRYPFAAGVISWYASSGDVYVRLGLSGLDLCLDGEVLPELQAWLAMVSSVLSDASRMHTSESSSQSQDMRGSLACVPREIRVVVEATAVRLSTIAPRRVGRPNPMFSFAHAVEFLCGSERGSDVILRIARVDIQRNVFEVEEIARFVAQEYVRMAYSRAMLAQMLPQLPSIVRFARVGVLSVLRRRREGHLGPGQRRMEGLLVGLTDVRSLPELLPGVYDRVGVMLPARGRSDISGGIGGRESRSDRTTHRPSVFGRVFSSDRIERPELVDMAGKAMDRAVFVAGLELFVRLSSKDSYLGRGKDLYKYYVPYTNEAAVIVTNKNLVFVRLEDESIIEPRVPLSSITGYALQDGVHVTIYCNKMNGRPPRVWSRDTGSMVEAMFRTTSLTLECDDEVTAEWLLRNLPENPSSAPSVVAREHL